eukprot:2588774-Prymnesium_polylepis.1
MQRRTDQVRLVGTGAARRHDSTDRVRLPPEAQRAAGALQHRQHRRAARLAERPLTRRERERRRAVARPADMTHRRGELDHQRRVGGRRLDRAVENGLPGRARQRAWCAGRGRRCVCGGSGRDARLRWLHRHVGLDR